MAALPEPNPLLPQFGGGRRFELQRHLGSGGMGAVYEAIDKRDGSRVALKTVRTTNTEALLHLKAEFRALQDLRHEHLVDLFELFEVDGQWFFTMALIDGCDFLSYTRPGSSELSLSGVSETVISPHDRAVHERSRPTWQPGPGSERTPALARGQLDEARLRDAFSQLALGLCALHDAHKVHRDIKPSNVLISAEGRVVLVDFGLLTQLDDFGASDTGAVGTRAFMAPEQAAGERVTPAADWYGAGVVLYLALTGRLPFGGAELARKRAHFNAPPVRELNPVAPADLSTLCDDLLALDPAARPNAREVLRRLGHTAQVDRALAIAPFVGRQAELAALLDAFSASREHAVTALVLGESGVGKSMLARQLLDEVSARAPDTVVLSGRCYERELVPYKAFDGVVDALSHYLRGRGAAHAAAWVGEDAGALARIFPILRRVPAFAAAPAPNEDSLQAQRADAFSALRKLLAAIAQEFPLLVYIDDLQWADADSLLLLGELLRANVAPHLCLMATARPASHAAFDVPLELAQDVRRITLAPLLEGDARALASELLGAQASPRLADAIVREAAGHPLFLVALARYAEPSGELDLPSLKLDDALWARVERMDPQARRVLELLAVAGAPLFDKTLANAAALDAVSYAQSARALRTTHLARTSSAEKNAQIEPYHDRIRETVLAHLAPAELQARHASLADALEATGYAEQDPRSLVLHLEGAGLARKAAEQALRAAAHAASVLAFDRASDLYQTALRLGQFSAEQTHALSVALARSLTNAGRGPEAGEQYLKCVAGANAVDRLIYRRAAADQLLRSAHLERGVAVLSDVLSEIGERFPPPTRFTILSVVLQRLLIRLRGLGYVPRAEADIAPDRLMRLDVYHAVSAALSLIDTPRASVFQSRSLLLALRTGEPKRLALALVMEAGYLASQSAAGLARARELGAAVQAISDEANIPYLFAVNHLIKGFLEYHAGAFKLSAAHFHQGERLFRDTTLGSYHEQSVCRTFYLVCLRFTGQFSELWHGLLETCRDADRRGDRFLQAGLNLNANQAWVVRDQVVEARSRLERSIWTATSSGYTFQHWYERLARGELDLYERNSARALQELRAFLPAFRRTFMYTVRVHRTLAWYLLGRLLVATALQQPKPEAALAEASKLARRIDREDLGYGRVYGALLRGAIASQRLDFAAAELALRAALAEAESCDLEQYAAAARFRLGALLGGESGKELQAAAEAWMHAQQVVRPERALEVWAPGFV